MGPFAHVRCGQLIRLNTVGQSLYIWVCTSKVGMKLLDRTCMVHALGHIWISAKAFLNQVVLHPTIYGRVRIYIDTVLAELMCACS